MIHWDEIEMRVRGRAADARDVWQRVAEWIDADALVVFAWTPQCRDADDRDRVDALLERERTRFGAVWDDWANTSVISSRRDGDSLPGGAVPVAIVGDDGVTLVSQDDELAGVIAHLVRLYRTVGLESPARTWPTLAPSAVRALDRADVRSRTYECWFRDARRSVGPFTMAEITPAQVESLGLRVGSYGVLFAPAA